MFYILENSIITVNVKTAKKKRNDRNRCVFFCVMQWVDLQDVWNYLLSALSFLVNWLFL